MNKLKVLLTSLFLLITMLSPLPVAAQFESIEEACRSGNVSDSSVCEDIQGDPNPTTGDNSIFVIIANILSVIAGIIAVVVIIIAGITMMTSGGDSGKVKSSRDAIIYAVIGIVVIVLSRSLVLYVINLIG